ncbi:hypothetical protein P3S68_022273 [Capsicum galapagoense]
MDNQIYNLGSTPTAFMDTKHSTSNLAWIWVIETLATSNEIDTSLLIDLVKRIPEISDDVGRNARELVSLRVLETLSVQENSNAKNDASVPGDKIEFDQSVCCEDVLRHLLLGVSSDQKTARPEMSKWDFQPFITKKRSCLPKCALQQIKDTVDTTNPLSTSLKAKSVLEVGSHFRDGDRFNSVDSDGIKQSCEVKVDDAQHEHVLPSGNATLCLGAKMNGLQENQPRTLMPSKRRLMPLLFMKENREETEPILENGSDTCIKASKRFKQQVISSISSRGDAVHDFESSQRDGVSIELSARIPQAIVQKGNLENGALVGGSDDSYEGPASKVVRQNIGTSSHDDPLPEIMISEEKIQNVGSSSKACDELRTSSGSSQQAIHQDSRINWECNGGNLFKDELPEGAKKNTVESDEPEFSSGDEYHNEKTSLFAKRNYFISSHCTQGQDPLTTENGRELKLCVKCNEGGQLLICSLNTCLLVAHQSCLGSVPSFDDGGNFYCPICAYSRAISEYLEGKKMSSLARKDLASFVGVGARRQSKKSSRNSRRTKKN